MSKIFESPAPIVVGEAPFVTSHAPLRDAMRRAALALDDQTGPRVVLITGPEGSGKSALARHLLAGAVRGSTQTVRRLPVTIVGHEASLRRLGRDERRQPLLLEDVDEVPHRGQARLASGLMQRESPMILTARLESDETFAMLGLTRSLREILEPGHVPIPGLSERREDIATIASATLRGGCLADDALARLRSQVWHENVRELRSVLVGAAHFASRHGSSTIRHEHVDLALQGPTPSAPSLHATLLAEKCVSEEALARLPLRDASRLVEAALIMRAIRDADGNVALAGRRLRTPHSTLKSRVQALRKEVAAVAYWL